MIAANPLVNSVSAAPAEAGRAVAAKSVLLVLTGVLLFVVILLPARLSLFPQALMLGLLVSYLAVSVTGLWRRRSSGRMRLRVPDIAALLFLLLQLWELNTSIYRPNTWLYVMDVTSCTLLYFLVRLELGQPRYVRMIVTFLASLGLIVAALDCLLFFSRYTPWRSQGFAHLTDFREYFRFFGGTTNGEGVSLLLALLPFLVLAAVPVPGRSRKMQWVRLGAIPLALFVLALSFSRGAYLAGAVFLALAAILRLGCGLTTAASSRNWHLKILGPALGCVLLTGMLRPVVDTALAFKTRSQMRSGAGRMSIWRSSVGVIEDYPYFGVGGNNYALISSRFGENAVDRPFTARAFSLPLQLLEETGIAGFLVFSLLLGGTLVAAFRVLRSPEEDLDRRDRAALFIAQLVALAVHELNYSSVTLHPAVTHVMWLTFALAAAPRSWREGERL